MMMMVMMRGVMRGVMKKEEEEELQSTMTMKNTVVLHLALVDAFCCVCVLRACVACVLRVCVCVCVCVCCSMPPVMHDTNT